jgi:hypothetical protein
MKGIGERLGLAKILGSPMHWQSTTISTWFKVQVLLDSFFVH